LRRLGSGAAGDQVSCCGGVRWMIGISSFAAAETDRPDLAARRRGWATSSSTAS